MNNALLKHHIQNISQSKDTSIAEQILPVFPTAESLIEASQQDFQYVKGITPYRAQKLYTAFQIAKEIHRPVERITREQAMVIIARAMAITGLAADVSPADGELMLASFADAAEVSGWARSGVAAGIQAGVVSGRDDGRIAPGDSITRSEVAMIVRRLLQKSGLI